MLKHLRVTGWHTAAWLAVENTFRMCRFIRCRCDSTRFPSDSKPTLLICPSLSRSGFKMAALKMKWFNCEQTSLKNMGAAHVRDLKHQSSILNSAVRHWEEVYSLIKACFNFCVWWGNWCFLPITNQPGAADERRVSRQDGSEETLAYVVNILVE